MKILILLLMTACSHGQTWTTDFDQAKKDAANENKNILLVFSGSDWCAPCIKLEQTIWNSEAFKADAQKSWILVKADFPKKKAHQLTAELQKQNDALAESYNSDGNFPLVVMLDKLGKVLGKTGYKNIQPEAYLSLLHAMETKI